MHLFFCPALAYGPVVLPEEEAHHAAAVLRLKAGDHIGLLNGKGLRAEAELVEVGKRGCTAQVISIVNAPAERAASIHIAVAPTKQADRIEWFVEKAVELGIDRITPLLTSRTERTRSKTERLHRVAIAAMKQSQRTWLPRIDELTSLADLLKERMPTQRFFGWCEGDHVPLMRAYEPGTDALVLIGPEGDFSPEEAALLRDRDLTAVSLGAARLRTETAAIAACAWMSLRQG